METKTLEIRDEGTFMPILAIRLSSRNEAERYLLSRAGYGQTTEDHRSYVGLANIEGGRGQFSTDQYKWGTTRTLQIAHKYIRDNWETINNGDVIDVQFILKETDKMCLSDAIGF